MRTATELKAWLKANKGVYSHVILVADGSKHGVRFLDRDKPLRGSAVAKLFPKKGGAAQIVSCCAVGKDKKFARTLSKGVGVNEVLALDCKIDPQWQAHLVAGYFMCLEQNADMEAALDCALPAGVKGKPQLWRDGRATA